MNKPLETSKVSPPARSTGDGQGVASQTVAININHVDVLFGPRRQTTAALKLLDQGQNRDQILSQTGMVLGVADASLQVPAGSISVLMGLSGSGKSSLLRCINGLNKVTRGVLEVNCRGQAINVAACKPRALRKLKRFDLAMVFQQFALLPWATVAQNIGFGLSVRGESAALIKERVNAQLALIGLEAWADKPIHTLSGGMQQRVGLARAFATDADILLMDEPFSALDPLIREHLQDELLTLQARLQKTIVFVSHDLDEALKLGNRISIMEGGRIVQTGSVSDIVFKPANDYVQRFIANINPLSVLTAGTVMQPLHVADADGVVSGPEGMMIELEANRPVACRLNNQRLGVAQVYGADAEQELPEESVCSVSSTASVKTLLAIAAKTSMHTLVVDERGALCGVIGAQDLCASLIQQRHSPAE